MGRKRKRAGAMARLASGMPDLTLSGAVHSVRALSDMDGGAAVEREGLSRPWMRCFLSVLARTRNASEAARQAGVTKQGAYDARTRDERFARCWDAIDGALVDVLLVQHLERALFGWLEPVYDRGRLVGHRRKFDHALGVRLLEAFDDRFRRTGSPAGGDDGGPESKAAAVRAALAAMRSSVPTAAGDEADRAAQDEAARLAASSPMAGGPAPEAGDAPGARATGERPRLCLDCGRQEERGRCPDLSCPSNAPEPPPAPG